MDMTKRTYRLPPDLAAWLHYRAQVDKLSENELVVMCLKTMQNVTEGRTQLPASPRPAAVISSTPAQAGPAAPSGAD